MRAFPLATINSLAFVAYSGARIVFDQYYVTGQPSTPAYTAIAQAGIKLVVERDHDRTRQRIHRPVVDARAERGVAGRSRPTAGATCPAGLKPGAA